MSNEPQTMSDGNSELPSDTTENSSEDVPPGFEADFSVEDTYQDEGVQKVYVRGLGDALATLATFDDTLEFQGGGGRDGTSMIRPAVIAKLLNKHYESPEFDVSGSDVRKMKPQLPGALLDAITGDDISVEMQSDGSARVSMDGDEGNSEA